MKPIVVDSKFIKRELLILLGCFVAAVFFDLVGIIMYSRPATELLTTIGYEIAICLGMYLFVAFVRVLIFLISQPFRKKD